MSNLEFSLVFCLKYPYEMLHLYWDQEESMLEIPPMEDEQKFRRQIDTVGEAAEESAKNLLIECSELAESHFRTFCGIERKTRPTNIKMNLNVESLLWQTGRGRRRPRNWEVTIGAYLDLEKHKLQIWLWGRGGKKAENSIASILNRIPVVPSNILDFQPGTVTISQIDLLEGAKGLEVPKEPIIEKVRNGFKLIDKEHLEKIFKEIHRNL